MAFHILATLQADMSAAVRRDEAQPFDLPRAFVICRAVARVLCAAEYLRKDAFVWR